MSMTSRDVAFAVSNRGPSRRREALAAWVGPMQTGARETISSNRESISCSS
jgi:hypothetical protein